MKRDPDFAWFAACVLGSVAGLFVLALLGGCATKQEPPAELPHYPCERVENGRTVYFACSDQEWLMQQILKGKQ